MLFGQPTNTTEKINQLVYYCNKYLMLMVKFQLNNKKLGMEVHWWTDKRKWIRRQSVLTEGWQQLDVLHLPEGLILKETRQWLSLFPWQSAIYGMSTYLSEILGERKSNYWKSPVDVLGEWKSSCFGKFGLARRHLQTRNSAIATEPNERRKITLGQGGYYIRIVRIDGKCFRV